MARDQRDCRCGGPWYVHVSQVDPQRTLVGNRDVSGDCAHCHLGGIWCPGYEPPEVVVDDDPPIPDSPMRSADDHQPVGDADTPYARVREGGNV